MANHTSTQTTATRALTDAEATRLRKLYRLHEEAANFTQSMDRLDRLNAYEHKLMADGVGFDALNDALGR